MIRIGEVAANKSRMTNAAWAALRSLDLETSYTIAKLTKIDGVDMDEQQVESAPIAPDNTGSGREDEVELYLDDDSIGTGGVDSTIEPPIESEVDEAKEYPTLDIPLISVELV